VTKLLLFGELPKI